MYPASPFNMSKPDFLLDISRYFPARSLADEVFDLGMELNRHLQGITNVSGEHTESVYGTPTIVQEFF